MLYFSFFVTPIFRLNRPKFNQIWLFLGNLALHGQFLGLIKLGRFGDRLSFLADRLLLINFVAGLSKLLVDSL